MRCCGDGALAQIVEKTADIGEFDARQRIPDVDRFDHVTVIDNVALVPQRSHRGRGLVDVGVDATGLGVERPPAAFGLDCAVGSIGARPFDAGTGALGYLVEAVFQDLGTDLDRLEQRIEPGIAHHRSVLHIS